MSNEPIAADEVEALRRWLDKELVAAKRVMKMSAERGDGYANFAAHDAHKHLTAMSSILTATTAKPSETEENAKLRARVGEECAQLVENEMPATQDMESTQICDALERAAKAIRARSNTGGGNGK